VLVLVGIMMSEEEEEEEVKVEEVIASSCASIAHRSRHPVALECGLLRMRMQPSAGRQTLVGPAHLVHGHGAQALRSSSLLSLQRPWPGRAGETSRAPQVAPYYTSPSAFWREHHRARARRPEPRCNGQRGQQHHKPHSPRGMEMSTRTSHLRTISSCPNQIAKTQGAFAGCPEDPEWLFRYTVYMFR